MFAKYVLAALLSATWVSANAAWVTGSDLHEMFAAYKRVQSGQAKDADALQSFIGIGYVEGAVDAGQGLVCIREGVKVNQLVAVMQQYLDDHPEKWDLRGDEVVYLALKNSFPCKRSR